MSTDPSPIQKLDQRIGALQSCVDELKDLSSEDERRKVVAELVDVYFGAHALNPDRAARLGKGPSSIERQSPPSDSVDDALDQLGRNARPSPKTPRKEPRNDGTREYRPGVMTETLEWARRFVAAQEKLGTDKEMRGFTNADLCAWTGKTPSGMDQRIHAMLSRKLIVRNVRGRYLPTSAK